MLSGLATCVECRLEGWPLLGIKFHAVHFHSWPGSAARGATVVLAALMAMCHSQGVGQLRNAVKAADITAPVRTLFLPTGCPGGTRPATGGGLRCPGLNASGTRLLHAGKRPPRSAKTFLTTRWPVAPRLKLATLAGTLILICIDKFLRRNDTPRTQNNIGKSRTGYPVESHQDPGVVAVVIRQEKYFRVHLQKNLPVQEIASQRERALGLSSQPRQELAFDLNRRSSVGRRLLRTRQLLHDIQVAPVPTTRCPIGAAVARRASIGRLGVSKFNHRVRATCGAEAVPFRVMLRLLYAKSVRVFTGTANVH